MTILGIDMDRHTFLRGVDLDYRLWLQANQRELYWCWRLVSLNEGLTWWRLHCYLIGDNGKPVILDGEMVSATHTAELKGKAMAYWVVELPELAEVSS